MLTLSPTDPCAALHSWGYMGIHFRTTARWGAGSFLLMLLTIVLVDFGNGEHLTSPGVFLVVGVGIFSLVGIFKGYSLERKYRSAGGCAGTISLSGASLLFLIFLSANTASQSHIEPMVSDVKNIIISRAEAGNERVLSESAMNIWSSKMSSCLKGGISSERCIEDSEKIAHSFDEAQTLQVIEANKLLKQALESQGN